jgi:hypothetical protein
MQCLRHVGLQPAAATVPTGDWPGDMVVDQATGRVYVADNVAARVSFFGFVRGVLVSELRSSSTSASCAPTTLGLAHGCRRRLSEGNLACRAIQKQLPLSDPVWARDHDPAHGDAGIAWPVASDIWPCRFRRAGRLPPPPSQSDAARNHRKHVGHRRHLQRGVAQRSPGGAGRERRARL